MPNDARRSGDDVELMARLADGDQSALAQLIQRHQHRVLDIAYRTIGDRVLAEDIAQEAFLRVWRSAGSYVPSAQFTTWLYRIVVNLCIDASRKPKALTIDGPAVPHPEMAAVSSGLERSDRIAAVRRAVARLPRRQRVALVLHRFSGLSIRVISDATGWSESAVESLLVRAYASLRQALTEFTES
ncbi:MAG: sigma-70 family RNA polymerase sigma factor [Phycisphaerales bacterium]|nr:MAG: sigma-70 family RNA polymerase sigma factor [Phycisphaerales bacterium]